MASFEKNECKFSMTQSGYRFDYDTPMELAELMFKSPVKAVNPYDPGTIAFDRFNEKILELANPND